MLALFLMAFVSLHLTAIAFSSSYDNEALILVAIMGCVIEFLVSIKVMEAIERRIESHVE